jgi:hypothetical protein
MPYRKPLLETTLNIKPQKFTEWFVPLYLLNTWNSMLYDYEKKYDKKVNDKIYYDYLRKEYNYNVSVYDNQHNEICNSENIIHQYRQTIKDNLDKIISYKKMRNYNYRRYNEHISLIMQFGDYDESSIKKLYPIDDEYENIIIKMRICIEELLNSLNYEMCYLENLTIQQNNTEQKLLHYEKYNELEYNKNENFIDYYYKKINYMNKMINKLRHKKNMEKIVGFEFVDNLVNEFSKKYDYIVKTPEDALKVSEEYLNILLRKYNSINVK